MLLLESWRGYTSVTGDYLRTWADQNQPTGLTFLNPGIAVGSVSIFVTRTTHFFAYGVNRCHLSFHFKPVSVTAAVDHANGSFVHQNADGVLNTNNQVGLSIGNDRRIRIFVGDNISGLGGTTVATGTVQLTLGEIYHFELDSLIDPTNGSVELRIHNNLGVLVETLSASTINTDAENRRYINSLTLIAGRGGGVETDYEFYDLAVDDCLAGVEWYGPSYVDWLLLNGDQTPQDFALSTGSVGFSLIQAPNVNVATNYVFSNTKPAESIFTQEGLSDTPALVHAVQVRTTSLANGAGTNKQGKPTVRVGNVYPEDGQARNHITSQLDYRGTWHRQPNGLPWDKASVDSAHVGFKTLPSLQGFDFRQTAGGATDPSHCTHVLGTDIYPVTRAGWTFGWEVTAPGTILNRGIGLEDARVRGVHAQVNDGNQRTWRLDLPSTGWWQVRLLVGDDSFTHTPVYYKVFDGATLLMTGDNVFGNLTGGFYDAGFDLGTRAHTNTGHTEREVSERYGRWFNFASTQLKVLVGTPVSSGALFSCLVHVEVSSGFNPGTSSASPEIRFGQLGFEVFRTVEQARLDFPPELYTIGLTWVEMALETPD